MTVRITPLLQGDMVELSKGQNLFERQILPFGKFHYQGREFDITPEWADNAIKAFNDRAVAQTWFHLADEKNSHDVDNRPDRYGGELVGMVKTDTGIKGKYKLTDKAASIVRENPRLGVSARFTTNYTREADQKTWPVVIDQVLGTLNPKIINTDEWKAVTLSEVDKNETVEDSSDGEWTVPEVDKVTLNKTEYDKLMAIIAASETTPAPEVVEGDTGDDDADLDSLLAELNTEDKNSKVAVGLSNANKKIAELSAQVASERFEKEKLGFVGNGVPPAIVELARPILSASESTETVTLSNGTETKHDVQAIVRKILTELQGTVKLSEESGHGFGNSNSVSDAISTELAALEKQIQGDLGNFGN